MFLIDGKRGRIASVRRDQLHVPFALLSGLRTRGDARDFLCRFRHYGTSLRQTLTAEMMHGSWGFSTHARDDADLIAAAAREIAAERLAVAVLLPETPVIRFDDLTPYGDALDNVVFPDRIAADAFIEALRTDRDGIAAMARALTHDASLRGRHQRPTFTPAAIPGTDWVPDEVAELLAAGPLSLRPLDPIQLIFQPILQNPARLVFRLAWRRPASTISRPAAAASAPSRPSRSPLVNASPPPAGAAPSSAPQPSLSPQSGAPAAAPSTAAPSSPPQTGERITAMQIAALKEAAKAGTPFCEECAHEALARAAADA